MKYQASSPDEYISQLPEERKEAVSKIRQTIINNLPNGFKEEMSYGMIGYVVPHSLYPKGYHCDPKLPLPFMNIASQKNFIALYSSSVYAKKEIQNWFVNEYPKHCKTKLDMGKSCIRFKKMNDIPYSLIGELAKKMTVEEWIKIYEQTIKKDK
ncbi:DUF1801 domain-containing protein [Abyssalbus ytuae]|uniref:DUF1801 domain-containing protein n=1 Tax=Abyssalbus ytuae TaxID=2926907 RepID=A0A9E7D200_9FLAO|nr:DUF1801 domain-containing protein [Abyssalbus ytuae]UOB16179.1 DUF1801 domain-containing protein [Abyssalbus ytuae]